MKKALPYIVSLFVTILLVELGAWVWLAKFANEEQFTLLASRRQLSKRGILYKYTAHRYCGFIPKPNFRSRRTRHNSLGYKGDDIEPKKEGEQRILCLGGSTTEAPG
ncbi:MAG: hypothetical protein R6V12_16605 [Candidatus Hydrogenedentota bacterium]